MTLFAFPAGLFIVVLAMGLTVAVTGITLLLRARRFRGGPSSRKLLAAGAVTLAVGLFIAGGTTYCGIAWQANEQDFLSRFAFTYSVELEFNGSGMVRVSLPIPVEARLLEGLAVTPSSSAFAYNRSGAESALDVTFSVPTTLSAEFLGRSPPDRFEAANLTRNDVRVPCYGDSCRSQLSLEVLSGSVTAVHVQFRASWSNACNSVTWEQDAWIAPGTADYLGRWQAIAC